MRIKKLLLTIFIIFCGMLAFTSCAQSNDVKSISLDDYSAQNPIQVSMGKFDYDDYTLSVEYQNGSKGKIALEESMISDKDRLKFYQEGKSEISVKYKNASISVWIEVHRNEFLESVKLNDVIKVYTGETFVVEVEGDFPSATKILYPQGNTFKNAGTYGMSAVLQCDGYVSKTLSATVVIQKATYDVSNAQLYSQTFTYDKDYHKIAVKGRLAENENGTFTHSQSSLPEGVSVSYSITKIKEGDTVTPISSNKQQTVAGNTAIDAGVYEVRAHFKGDVNNYNVIDDSIAYLTIEQAKFDLTNVEFTGAEYTYTGNKYTLAIAEGTKLPSDVTVSYQIKKVKNASGEEVEEEYKDGNSAVDAGEYIIKAVFTVNGKTANNYTTNPLYIEATLKINRASYDEQLGDLYLDLQYYKFEKDKIYTMWIDGVLPEGVVPVFCILDFDGNEIECNLKIETQDKVLKYVCEFTVNSAGEYLCLVALKHSNDNYQEIEYPLISWAIIEDEVDDEV